jgi:DNA-binding IclR family transcriptional regulator
MAVLWALEEGPRSLAELVAATGLARATAHRLATACEVHGLVARDEQGRFVLGPTLGRLAAAGGTSLAALAAPVLEELRDVTGESVQLYVRRGEERVCVVSLESPHSLRTMVGVGAVLPLARGSAGRVLSGEASSAGWIASVEEREPGVASVSAAVMDRRRGEPGRVVAAVSVSGPVERTTRSPGERYGDAVLLAATRLEESAGYGAGPR